MVIVIFPPGNGEVSRAVAFRSRFRAWARASNPNVSTVGLRAALPIHARRRIRGMMQQVEFFIEAPPLPKHAVPVS